MLGAASDVIRFTGQETIGWAAFDPDWYLRTYPNVRMILDANDPEAVLRFYLITGQQIGHSPNPYFDETWYLRQYPEAEAAVREGKFASGFDEYCRAGYGGRSPHWLYNDYLYRIAGEELTPDVIRAQGFANRYDHYLRRGSRAGRAAHLLFDPTYYRTQLDESEAVSADELGAFQHFVQRIAAGNPAPRTAIYFDPVWYACRYPAVAQQIGTIWLCSLHHYLTNTSPTEFDPIPEFSEASYLEQYPDIAAVIQAGDQRNGYQHFLSNGVLELRSPCDTIDLQYYVRHHYAVRSDLESGRVRDAFAHLLSIGRARGLASGLATRTRDPELRSPALTPQKPGGMTEPVLDPLSRLAIRHGTDKFGAHLYTPTYHTLFHCLRERSIRLLEIGIGGYGMPIIGGASLCMWAEYFPYGQIVGIDVAPKRLAMPPRVTIVQASQTDTDLLDRINDAHGPFDIVIDDGSHQAADVLASFHYLYPRLPLGAHYIVEDTQTAFWPEFGGNPTASGTILELAHQVALALHQEEVRAKGLEPVWSTYGALTSSVQLLRNLVIFERGENVYPSNAAFDAAHPEVQRIYALLAAEQERDPSPGAYLTRLEMDLYAGRLNEAMELAGQAADRYPDHVQVLHAAIRVFERAGHAPECLAVADKLTELVPDEISVAALRARIALGQR